MGDLLFTLTRLSAKLQIAPEDALRGAMARFEARFRYVEDQTLADGKIFSGDYLEITHQTATAELDPLWNEWDRGRTDGFSEVSMPDFGFATQYSGRVLAKLRSVDGQRMTCRLHLNVPSEGMAGGGQGRCDLNGGSVDAVFPRT